MSCSNTTVSYDINTTGCCLCPSSATSETTQCTFENTGFDNETCLCSVYILYSTCRNSISVTSTTPFKVILQGKQQN